MRTRLRLGAAASVGLGALLLATVLASPALAWHSTVTVTARCLDGQVRVHYTVAAWEKEGHEATVDVAYKLNGEVTELQSDDHFFGPKHNQFSGHFDLPAGTTGEITFVAVAHWKNGEESTDTGGTELPPADKCVEEEETPPSVPDETTPTTEAEQVEDVTSTTVQVEPSSTAGGQLPFTGASSVPMLVAGIALVGGGVLFLLVSRGREHRATR
jgi:hypothetical protein